MAINKPVPPDDRDPDPDWESDPEGGIDEGDIEPGREPDVHDEIYGQAPEQPKLQVVSSAELDEDEAEFNLLRRDLPGVKGASAVGFVTLSVGKLPGKHKNEFFRTHPDYRPIVQLVHDEVGMERQFFAVSPSMVGPLIVLGIEPADYTLYLTVTPQGSVKIVPIHCETDNEYARTKEIGLLDGIKRWVRLYADQKNGAYKVYPAPVGRYANPIWPDLKPAKIFRLAFRDKGRLIDSHEHPLVKKWAARDGRD